MRQMVTGSVKLPFNLLVANSERGKVQKMESAAVLHSRQRQRERQDRKEKKLGCQGSTVAFEELPWRRREGVWPNGAEPSFSTMVKSRPREHIYVNRVQTSST